MSPSVSTILWESNSCTKYPFCYNDPSSFSFFPSFFSQRTSRIPKTYCHLFCIKNVINSELKMPLTSICGSSSISFLHKNRYVIDYNLISILTAASIRNVQIMLMFGFKFAPISYLAFIVGCVASLRLLKYSIFFYGFITK